MRSTRSGVGTITGRPSVQLERVQQLDGLRFVRRLEEGAHGPRPARAATTASATASATRSMFAGPVPETGCGRRTRGASGMPREAATKSPWGQNSSVTSATEGRPRRAAAMPSRTVPVVQLPQCPQAATTASQPCSISSSMASGAGIEALPLFQCRVSSCGRLLAAPPRPGPRGRHGVRESRSRGSRRGRRWPRADRWRGHRVSPRWPWAPGGLGTGSWRRALVSEWPINETEPAGTVKPAPGARRRPRPVERALGPAAAAAAAAARAPCRSPAAAA
jgi:hypothetical protein